MAFDRGDEAPAASLVGRQRERALLDETIDALPATGARTLLIRGEAGIGKSALVDHATRGTRGALARGHCVPVGHTGLPFAPISGVLRALRNTHGDAALAEWSGASFAALGALSPDLVTPGGDDRDQLRLFDAVSHVLAGAATAAPLIVVIEDLHWADDSTLALLRFLAGDLGSAPVLILGTQRTGDAEMRRQTRTAIAELTRRPTVRTLDIGPLSPDETAELAQRAAATTLPAERLSRIHERSGGNAFYAQELAAADTDTLPEHLRDVLRAQTAQLGDDAADTVRIIATIGVRADDSIVRTVSTLDDDTLDRALREAVDLGMLRTDATGYRFRHALLREEVEAEALPGQWQRLHLAVAKTLALAPAPDTATRHARALHLLAGRDWSAAFPALVDAARASTVAHAETARMYEHILELWDLVDSPEEIAGPHADLLEAAANAARDAGEFARAAELMTLALAEPSTVENRFRRLVFRLHVTIDLVRPGAERDAAEAESLLPQLADERVRAHATEQIASYYLNAGLDGRTVAADAVRLASEVGDAVLLAQAHTTLGTMLVARGDEHEGLEELDRAEAVAPGDSRSALRVHLNYSDALHVTGHYASARDHAEQGAAIAAGLGLTRAWGAFVVGNVSEALLALGGWGEASAAIDAALAHTPPAIAHTHLSILRAWLWTWTGRSDEAGELLRSVPHLLEGAGAVPQLAAHALRTESEHAFFLGDHARAWRAGEIVLRDRDRFGPARTLPALVAGAAAARHLDETEPIEGLPDARTTRVREVLDEHPSTLSRRVWAPVIEAALTDSADAWAEALEALEALDGGDHPAHLRPYATWRLAQHLAQTRDRAAARQAIDAGRAQAEQLGAMTLIHRFAILSTQVGSTGWERTGGGPLAALSSRELDVLRLVAEGRTNAAIGAALFISPKTVSVHVSNILTKLNVRTRAEATGVAHRSGLVS